MPLSFLLTDLILVLQVGKRFRSRNELKAFFEKTQEQNLEPEDFDFSTFGTGHTLGRYGNKVTMRNSKFLMHLRLNQKNICQCLELGLKNMLKFLKWLRSSMVGF
jgi:hypothetical protein